MLRSRWCTAALLAAVGMTDARNYFGGYTHVDRLTPGPQPLWLFPMLSCADGMFANGCSCSTPLAAAAVWLDHCEAVTSFYAARNRQLTERYDPATCTLALEGMAPLATYIDEVKNTKLVTQTTAASLVVSYTFTQLSGLPGAIKYNPGTRHFYMAVGADAVPVVGGGGGGGGLTWREAQAYCSDAGRDFFGFLGYLATVATAAEAVFLGRHVLPPGPGQAGAMGAADARYALGASDIAVSAAWRWVTGPDGGCASLARPAGDYRRTACDLGSLVNGRTCRSTGGPAGACDADVGVAVGGVLAPFKPDNLDASLAATLPDGGFGAVAPTDPASRTRRALRFSRVAIDEPVGYICEWGGVGALECMSLATIAGRTLLVTAGTLVDECTFPPQKCLDGQVCSDTDTSFASLGDWTCACLPPAVPAVAGPPVLGRSAVCAVDECLPTAACDYCLGSRCDAVGQRCEDPDPNTLKTWVCVCPVNPATTKLVEILPATECPVDECTSGPSFPRCPAPAQTCVDPDLWVWGNWECHCAAPFTGPPHVRGAAVCVAPATSVPTTSVPATSVPATSVPATSVPATSVPTTSVPATTWAPATSMPAVVTATPVLASDAPQTRTPLSGGPGSGSGSGSGEEPPASHAVVYVVPDAVHAGLSQRAKEELQRFSVLVTLVVLSPGGQATMPGILAAVRNLECAVDVDDLDTDFNVTIDVEYSPLPLALGSGSDRYFLGAVLGNIICLTVFMLLLLIISHIIRKQLHIQWDAALGYACAPGLLAGPYLLLLCGTSLCAMRLTMNHQQVGLPVACVGAAVVVLCCISPMVLQKKVLKLAQKKALIVQDPRVVPDVEPYRKTFVTGRGELISRLRGVPAAVYRCVYGTKIWVSYGDRHFCEKKGAVFDRLRQTHLLAVIVDMVSVLVVSMLSGWRPGFGRACHIRNSLITTSLLVVFVYQATSRPHLALLDNVHTAAVAGMNLVAAASLTFAIALEQPITHSSREVGRCCLVWATWLVISKGVFDMLACLVDVYLSRTSGARHHQRVVARTNAAKLVNPMTLASVAPGRNPLADHAAADDAWSLDSTAFELALRGESAGDETLLQAFHSSPQRLSPKSSHGCGTGGLEVVDATIDGTATAVSVDAADTVGIGAARHSPDAVGEVDDDATGPLVSTPTVLPLPAARARGKPPPPASGGGVRQRGREFAREDSSATLIALSKTYSGPEGVGGSGGSGSMRRTDRPRPRWRTGGDGTPQQGPLSGHPAGSATPPGVGERRRGGSTPKAPPPLMLDSGGVGGGGSARARRQTQFGRPSSLLLQEYGSPPVVQKRRRTAPHNSPELRPSALVAGRHPGSRTSSFALAMADPDGCVLVGARRVVTPATDALRADIPARASTARGGGRATVSMDGGSSDSSLPQHPSRDAGAGSVVSSNPSSPAVPVGFDAADGIRVTAARGEHMRRLTAIPDVDALNTPAGIALPSPAAALSPTTFGFGNPHARRTSRHRAASPFTPDGQRVVSPRYRVATPLAGSSGGAQGGGVRDSTPTPPRQRRLFSATPPSPAAGPRRRRASLHMVRAASLSVDLAASL